MSITRYQQLTARYVAVRSTVTAAAVHVETGHDRHNTTCTCIRRDTRLEARFAAFHTLLKEAS